jgi:hypothetical protein
MTLKERRKKSIWELGKYYFANFKKHGFSISFEIDLIKVQSIKH